MKKDIKDKKNEEEIENVVKEECKYINNYVEGKCREFVDNYGNEVIDIIEKEIEK